MQSSRVGRPLKHLCVGYAMFNWTSVGVEETCGAPAICCVYRLAF